MEIKLILYKTIKYKITRFSTFFLPILLSLTSFDESWSAYRVMGTGNQDCKLITFHRDVKEVKSLTISWVQGFLTGLNLAMSRQYHSIGNNISDKKIWEEIITYCEKNPKYSLTKASESIFMKLNNQPE